MNCIKGKHAITEALKARSPIDRIVIPYDLREKSDFKVIIALARQAQVKVQIVSKQAFAKQSLDQGEDHTQGIIAYLPMAQHAGIEELNPTEHPVLVILDHIEDPHNMGAILRTCETLGVKAVIYPKDRQCQITPTVVKVASGATQHLNMIRVTNLGQAVDKLKELGYWIYGSDDQGEADLDHFKPNLPFALVLGNEGRGMSTLLTKKLDARIRIPLVGAVSSLNVSVATGILLYQLTRIRAVGQT